MHERFVPFLVVAVLLMMTGAAMAQMSVQVTEIETSSFPRVKMKVVTKKGNLLRRDLDSSSYLVREEGLQQSPPSLRCDVGTTPFSVIFCIGNGSTVSLGDLTFAKGAVNSMINELDGLNDEAAIVTYSDAPLTGQNITNVKALLTNVLANINTTPNANHFWDGVYHALTEAANASNKRCVFLLSNGRDDGSGRTPSQVIAYAATVNAKVHVLAINAGSGEQNLQTVTQQTGGQYFTDPDHAVQTIVNLLRGTPDYCTLEYTSSNVCKDGIPRNVSVRVKVGNDSAATATQYPLGPDPATNVLATFAVDTGSVISGKRISLPLLLTTEVTGQLLFPASLSVAFDNTKLTLVDARTDSTIALTNAASFTSTATGADIALTGLTQLSGKGPILRMIFSGADVTTNTPVPVQIQTFTFTRGCIQPQLQAGRVTVLPKTRSIKGQSTPFIFSWNESAGDYNPSPGILRLEITNSGDLPVTGLQSTLPSTPELTLVYASISVAPVNPSTLNPGQKGVAEWYVRAVPRATELSPQYDVVTRSSEGTETTTKMFVNIKPASSAVAVVCITDQISIQGGQHAPNPATVRAVVKSAGTQNSPAGDVRLQLPPELQRVAGNETQSFNTMPSGATDTIRWQVSFPTTDTTDRDYRIEVVTAVSGRRTDTSFAIFRVPALKGASLSASCAVLRNSPWTGTHWLYAYDSAQKKYPPAEIRGIVRNNGSSTSDSVIATLTVAGDLILAGGETARKVLTVSLAAGDSAAVSWMVEISSVSCSDRDVTLAYNVSSAGTDITACDVPIRIQRRPNLLPEVLSRTPPIDTVALGSQKTFVVNAIDANGDRITYRWFLNGSPVGTDSAAFTSVYSKKDTYILRCEIADPCGASVSVEWQFIVDNVLNASATPSHHGFVLSGNYPNPFHRVTTVEYVVPPGRHALVLDVIDQLGRVMAVLEDGILSGGTYRSVISHGMKNGVYYVRLRSGATEFRHAIVVIQ